MTDPALGGQLERGDAGQLDLARSGEPGAVPGQGEADAAGDPIRARCAMAHPAPCPSPHAAVARRRSVPAAGRTPPPRRPAPGPPPRPRSRAGPGRSASCRPAGRRCAGGCRAARARACSAIRLRWVSAANSVCGAPKPRNAPFGGVLVRVARARMRTFGQRYGPPACERAAAEHDRRERAVRAAVHDDLDVLGDERAVAGDAGPVADDGRVALGRGGDVLVAVVDHPDRALGLAGEERRVQPDDRRELLLATEPAAGLRLDDPRRIVVEPEAALERPVQVVRALERAGDGDAAALGRDGDHRVVLDVQLLLVADPVLALDDEVRGRRGRPPRPPVSMRYSAKVWSLASGSKTGASRVVRGVARCRASRSVARSGAARSASGSAWCWISPPSGTRIGWSLLMLLTMFSPGMSAAVTTTTLVQSKAGSRSSASKVAWASVERIVAPYQAPGTTMSSVYRAVPVSLAGPSRR